MVKNRISAIINLTEDGRPLQPLTNYRPIGGLPYAGRYRVIDFLLSDVAYAGIDSVALFIGESGRSIYDHIRSGEPWDLNSQVQGGIFTFSQQNWKAKHHLEDEIEDFYYNHRLFLERSKTGYVFVAGSRIIANVDIRAIQQQHRTAGKDVTVVYKTVLHENVNNNSHIQPQVVTRLKNGNETVVEYEYIKSDKQIDVSLGMYMLSIDKMLELIEQALEDEVYLELDELIKHYIEQLQVNSYEYTGYSASIEDIDTYYQANMDMLDRSKFTSLFYSSIPILTKNKNGAPTFYHEDSHVRNSIIGSDVMLYGRVEHSVLNRRVEVAKDAEVLNSVLLQGSKIGEGAKVEYAIIDKNTIVEPGAELIGTPDNIKVISKNSIVHA